MLLDPETLDLAPVAPVALARLDGDSRFKLELPAAQLEIVTAAVTTVAEAAAELRAGRERLAAALDGLARPAAAGTHPFAAAEGELNPGPRYEHTVERFGRIARRQLVCALQIHVAPGGAAPALAVYDALRSYLPELAALAANAPFHDGVDTGLASARPKLAEQLPRQGVPPPLASWAAYAEALRWGEAAGALPGPTAWWWELRPNVRFGTLEIRVPDAQSTVDDAAAIAALAQCLVAELCERYDRGESLPSAASWRIEENRWSAARCGVEGSLADLETGERRPTGERLAALVAVRRAAGPPSRLRRRARARPRARDRERRDAPARGRRAPRPPRPGRLARRSLARVAANRAGTASLQNDERTTRSERMKAVTWQGRRDVRVEEVPDPRIERSTDAIIRVTSPGICGSDLHLYEVLGMFIDPGDILGHEPMGDRRGGRHRGRADRARRPGRDPVQHLLRALLDVRPAAVRAVRDDPEP